MPARLLPARPRGVMLTALLAAIALALLAPHVARAAANAVIPMSSSPGTSPNVINNYVQVNFPANDDGTWPCGGNGNAPPPCPGPNGETGPTTVPLGFNINFFGTQYSGAYVNNNGNVTFDAPLAQFTPSDLTTFGSPIIATYFADVDTRGAGSATVNLGTGTLNGMKVFVVNWPGVGCYDQNGSVLDNFQMIIIDRPDRGTGPNGDDFDMEFNYDSMQWDTGQASGGDANCINGPSGSSAFVGYSNGTSNAGDSYNLPGSGVPNSFIDANTSTGLIYNDLNSTTLGRYIFTVVNGQPTQPTTLTTSLSGGGQSGMSITVPQGTGVTDSATLGGSNASSATGTITYNVYSDSSCTQLVSAGSPESIATPGTMPGSQTVTLNTPGTYYWQAVYSGDNANNGSTSNCTPGGPNEVETVTSNDPQISASGVTKTWPQRCEVVARFSDPDTSASPSEYSASVNWGDGRLSSETTILQAAPGRFAVRACHAYSTHNTYHATVTITDVDNSSNTATANSTLTY